MDQPPVAAPPEPAPSAEMKRTTTTTTTTTATKATTTTNAEQIQDQDQTHLKAHSASSPNDQAHSHPNTRKQRSLKGVLAAFSIILLCLGLLFVLASLVAKGTDEDHGDSGQSDTSNTVPPKSAWFVTRRSIFELAWAVAVLFGCHRLLGQGFGAHLQSPRLQALARTLHLEELTEVLNFSALAVLIIAMSTLFRGYSWQAYGYDMCNRAGLDRVVYLPIVERRTPMAIFSACLQALGQHINISALFFRFGGEWITMKGLVIMLVSAQAVVGLMVWLGLCRFAVVMQNSSLLIVGVYLVSWLVSKAKIFLGFFRSRSDLESRHFQTLGELGLYTLILWTAKSAPVALFCEPDSCEG